MDRCFTVAGFGTVVTGTLIDGSLSVGQEAKLVLSGQKGRIRNLQSHKKKLTNAEPGRRLAVNLSGITREGIQRGEVITSTDWLQPTTRLDAKVKLARDAPHSLKHNEGVTIHLFTSESTARIRLLDKDVAKPGEEAWTQVHLQSPIPAVKGDLFVIRSSDATLGGGRVVDPSPMRRHRRMVPSVLERLMAMDEGTQEDTLYSAVEHWGPCDINTLSRRANLSEDDVLEGINDLSAAGQVVVLGNPNTQADAIVYSSTTWQSMKTKCTTRSRDLPPAAPSTQGYPA